MDALGQAGGPTEDANLSRIHVIRPDAGVHLTLSLAQLLKPDPSLNVAMREGDVQRSGVAKIGWLFDQINPFTSLLILDQLLGQDE